jgi:DNA-binding MarR family transcriptional regulator
MTRRKSPDEESARELAVVLHDLAWLLPRTIGAEAMQAEPQPPTALEVMRLLTRTPGLSVNDVGREIGVQANNVSTAVKLLEDRGLLEKRRDEEDGRVTRLHPTDRALAARARRERSWGESMREAMAGLSPTDAATLVNASQALRALAEHLAQPDRS